jgi:hypothetical protein
MQTLLSIIIAVLVFVTTVALPANAQTNDDITLQTRLEQNTLSWLIDKTRLILANVQIDDKLSDEVILDRAPEFDMGELSNDADFTHMQELISSVFHVDLKNAVIRLRIPKVQYRIAGVHAKPISLDVHDPVLDLRVQAQLNGVYAKLSEGIQADLMIPNPTTGILESYLTASVEPLSIEIPKTAEAMKLEIDFETLRGSDFKFNLKSVNLDAVPDYVIRNQKSMTILAGAAQKSGLTADHISVNPIYLRINSMSRTFKFDAFKPILQKKLPQIMSSVLALVGESLKNKIGPRILQTVFDSRIKSDLVVSNANIYTRYVTALFSQPDTNQLSLGVQGDLCTAEAYNRYHEQCTQFEPRTEPVRAVSVTDKQKAQEELRDLLARGKTDIALSISEEYINRLIRTTIDAKAWDEMLAEDHLAIGPKGVFVVFDQRTKNPELFLDLYYLGDKGVEKVFVNPKHPIRFPLRMSTSLSFVLKEEIPFLVIKTEKLLSDANEVINGIPQYGLNSKLVPLLKRKIAKMVIDMASKLEGKNAVEMDIPVMKGVGLEKATYEATPYGRLNIYIKIDPAI